MTFDVYNAKKKRVKEVIEALQANVYLLIRQCALKFKISKRTFQNWWNEKALKFTRESINKRLFTAQERVIKNYIIYINAKNMLLTLKLIDEIVNFVLREADLNTTSVRRIWSDVFSIISIFCRCLCQRNDEEFRYYLSCMNMIILKQKLVIYYDRWIIYEWMKWI